MMEVQSSADFWIQLVPVTLLAALCMIPSIRILRRVGKSWAWSLFAIWPIIGIIVVLWVIAYSRWQPEPEVSN